MGLIINNIDQLQWYLIRISRRAIHHDFSELILALAGAVVMFKDPDTQLEIQTYREVSSDVLFLIISGATYVVVYDYQQEAVEVKQDSIHGRIVANFTGDTPVSKIFQIFQDLKRNNTCNGDKLKT